MIINSWCGAGGEDCLYSGERCDVHRLLSRVKELEGAAREARAFLNGWEYVDPSGQRRRVPINLHKADAALRTALNPPEEEPDRTSSRMSESTEGGGA